MTSKYTIFFSTALLAMILQPDFSHADIDLSQKLSGRILLQVESNGEAWYVNPADKSRYYMGRPNDALILMRSSGIGITDANLEKIPVGLIESGETDSDNDGLSDALENALGSDPKKADSDGDGYDDKSELENNYDLSGAGKIKIDTDFADSNKGKIFLQIEKNGEAWYVNPTDGKRYFLSRPHIAFEAMKKFGLGITTANLNQIAIKNLNQNNSDTNRSPSQNINQSQQKEIFYAAASAIMAGNSDEAITYFTDEMRSVVEYTFNFLNPEGEFNLGNIMSGATLTNSTDTEKIYSTTISFSGYTTTLNFRVLKQPDGTWLLANL